MLLYCVKFACFSCEFIMTILYYFCFKGRLIFISDKGSAEVFLKYANFERLDKEEIFYTKSLDM